MIDLDELASLARDVGEDETWCLHPNGYSVWTGDQWDASNIEQEMIARSGVMTDEISVKRMMLVAGLHPKVVLELTERARGLSDTKIVYGPEDNDEVCVACELPTTGGHAHVECYAAGKSDGRLEENIDCSQELAQVFGVDCTGDFNGTLILAVQKYQHFLEKIVAPGSFTNSPTIG